MKGYIHNYKMPTAIAVGDRKIIDYLPAIQPTRNIFFVRVLTLFVILSMIERGNTVSLRSADNCCPVQRSARLSPQLALTRCDFYLLLMPNQRLILHYITFYQSVLKKLGLKVAWDDLKPLIPLVNLIFQVDSLYDVEETSCSSQNLDELQENMSQLMSHASRLTQPAIQRFFQAMELELSEGSGDSLTNYLQISRYSIGAELLASYLAYLLHISPDIWFSSQINHFNQEIYTLIRLANDYLDVTVEQKRRETERRQIQATDFFPNLLTFKGYFLARFLGHKFRYYCYGVSSSYFRSSPEKEMYLTALRCAESILIWAYKVYITDQNSVHEIPRT